MKYLILFLVFFGSCGFAETVTVQSGEHAGFSRLVLRLPQPVEWHLGRVGSGYELRLTKSDIELDLTRVFTFIPRSRIEAIDAPPGGATLHLRTAAETYATAFEISPGTIVVDVASGQPEAGSRFELPLDPVEVPVSPPTTPARLPRPTANPDSRLDLYWRDTVVPAPRVEVAASPAAEPQRDLHPDPRVAEAEQQLLMQLGRAATQGILTLDLPQPVTPASETGIGAPGLGSAETPQPQASVPDSLSIRSETVFDRDSAHSTISNHLTPVGRVCLKDPVVDVAAWISDLPVSIQLADIQRQLVGEFDRPSQDAVLAMARLYLAMGLGAEVGMLFDALGVEPPDADVLRSMADVLDDRPVAASARLSQMADCEGAAAFWAVLANPTLQRGDQVNFSAVERTFSALPLHLRLQLGPQLVERLLVLGGGDSARRVRDAITRAQGEPSSVVNMIDAQMEIASGKPEQAQASLAPVIAENGPDAPGATLMYIDSVLQQGAVVDQKTIEAVAALAFEHLDAPDGADLARAHILAAGSAGQFDRAFEALTAMPSTADEGLSGHTTSELFALLAQERSDAIFLEQIFRRKRQLGAQQSKALQLQIAARLLDLGFADDALRTMGPEAIHSDQGRMLRARSLLLQDKGGAALAEIGGLDSPEAHRIRGEALGLLGDHSGARRAYALAGAETEGAAEAWRGGEWAIVAQSGTAAQRGALAEFGLVAAAETVPAAAAPQSGAGALAQAQSLLENSRAARAALDALLAETAAQ